MGKIAILSPELINQIAAGEVVERPASVIKELVENAIDAGASRIEIQSGDGGRSLRVADNGCGMEKSDLEVAFHNHATSKISSVSDLFDIHTLGFRGEALASIAAISKITCMSRTTESPNGLKATVKPSGEVSLQETGCAVGTIFEIKELFYNVPVRLKFLKRPQTELSHIQEIVQGLALSHPEIAFQLDLEKSQVLKTSGSGDLQQTIQEVFSLGSQEAMCSFELRDEAFGYRVWGKTSTPNVTRGSKKWIAIFVNGRYVRCPILGKAIESAYTSLIVPGKFPVTVLFLELPPQELDVNVHPTKREVRYERANTMFSFVRRALEEALHQGGLAKLSGSTEAGSQEPLSSFKSHVDVPVIKTSFTPSEIPSRRESFTQSSRPNEFKQRDTAYHQAAMDLYQPNLENSGPKQPFLPQIPSFRVIGQLSATYVLLETREGLLVVDQHIAAERVLFELFSEQAEQTSPVSQQLLIPMVFHVSPLQVASLTENQPAFASLGFQYDLADQAVHFTWVPSLYNEKVLKVSLQGLLSHLEETGEVKLSVDEVIATSACHAAIRAGDLLNHEQMTRVIGQWFQCQRPWTCPHGRPVSHLLKHAELMHFFERPSLPSTASTPTLTGGVL
jgi:DNA mismatch repair protein MutL